MTRSALPTGPCGSSTPSLHDAASNAALVIDAARSHLMGVLSVRLARLDMVRNSVEIPRFSQSPLWGAVSEHQRGRVSFISYYVSIFSPFSQEGDEFGLQTTWSAVDQ